ncbi:MAG TPA: hypothetical protein VGE43_13655 [Acidimicrobiales bacterium]
MGRFYRPETKPDKVEDTPGQVGPEGRFYLPPTEAPEDDAPAEDVDFEAGDPNEQASALAGDPPTTGDGDSTEAEGESDPAAETLQEDPNEAASLLAGDPPAESVQTEQPAGNASRDEWAAYALSLDGVTDADLVDDEGKDLGRDALREKYGTPPAS